MPEANLKSREKTHSVRLNLKCLCGFDQTFYVHPDAPSTTLAKAHGWRFVITSWVCPTCIARAEAE